MKIRSNYEILKGLLNNIYFTHLMFVKCSIRWNLSITCKDRMFLQQFPTKQKEILEVNREIT